MVVTVVVIIVVTKGTRQELAYAFFLVERCVV